MVDEVSKAQTAVAEEVTIFDKIVAKQIPANIIYEDEQALAFRDINPVAPTHFLVIPKNRNGLTELSKAKPEHAQLIGHLFVVAAKVAAQEGLTEGYRTVINTGKEGCKTLFIYLNLLQANLCITCIFMLSVASNSHGLQVFDLFALKIRSVKKDHFQMIHLMFILNV